MKYNFYEILGVSRDADTQEITLALYSKLEELKDSKDIRLWNYLLRTASDLQIQLDKNKLEESEAVSEEFYLILGATPDTSKEELTMLLREKYKDSTVLSNVRIWNILHRESQKLGIDNLEETAILNSDGPKVIK